MKTATMLEEGVILFWNVLRKLVFWSINFQVWIASLQLDAFFCYDYEPQLEVSDAWLQQSANIK